MARNRKWQKYALEFLSIFIAVISAFALSNWNDNRKSNKSEEKILLEISNGLNRDLADFSVNMRGHRMSIRAVSVFRDLLNNKPVLQDSMAIHYITLFRDYPPIVNSSGYESLKSSGIKTVTNDSLRFQIVELYDHYYSIIKLLENDVQEMQSYLNYFKPINQAMSPYIQYDADGSLVSIEFPSGLSKNSRKEILSYLWRLELNRRYKLKKYELVKGEINKVKVSIQQELQENF
ncbi:MAG: DUF6090 family protein [Bacteroidota bacterium]